MARRIGASAQNLPTYGVSEEIAEILQRAPYDDEPTKAVNRMRAGRQDQQDEPAARRLNKAMTGLVPFFPIYLNGVLALFFVFVLPGWVLVRGLDIPNFPLRWLAVFLGSMTASHLLVTLVATLQLEPLQAFRVVTAVLLAIPAILVLRPVLTRRTAARPGGSIMQLSDAIWLLVGTVVLGLTYFNVWKNGVPNIFPGGDVAVSWNPWALIWSKGSFPTGAYGYPQFVPTIWAITYIFTGSVEQYFAYYTYIVFILVPLILCTAILGRRSWRYAGTLLLVFAWFVAEIRQPWLRATLQEGFPDWVAAISGYCGIALFIVNRPGERLDRDKIVIALASLCLVSISAMTKPLNGLFTIAILIATCTDAARHLDAARRNRLIFGAIALVAAFAAAYAVYYSHLGSRSMPNYPVALLSDRLARAGGQLNSNFTIPFRILLFAGLVLSPFLPRVRWLALPLVTILAVWANTASYDLRNLLCALLVAAFIPLHALAQHLAAPIRSGERQWRIADGPVAIILAMLCVLITLPLALSDGKLKQRFADEQMRRGLGIELNRPIGELLARGCTIFSADAYIYTVAAFQPYRQQIAFFHFAEPATEALKKSLDDATGCVGIVYLPDRSHPSIRALIESISTSHGYSRMLRHEETELLVSEQKAQASKSP